MTQDSTAAQPAVAARLEKKLSQAKGENRFLTFLRDFFAYWPTVYFLRGLGKIFNRAELYGLENLPKKGPYVAVVNHQSHWDSVGSSFAVRTRVHVMVKHTLVKIPILGWFLRAIYVFPVKRGRLDRKAFEHAVELLKKGDVLFIAPEGTRRKDRNTPPPKPRNGFVLFAQLAKCPVVPIAIWGTDRVLPPHSFLPRPRKIRVMIGEPINLPEVEPVAKNKDELQRQAEMVMGKVYEMWEKLDAMGRKKRK